MRLEGVKEDPVPPRQIEPIQVEIQSPASRRLLELAEITYVQEQVRDITGRLGVSVAKVGREDGVGVEPQNDSTSPPQTADQEVPSGDIVQSPRR